MHEKEDGFFYYLRFLVPNYSRTGLCPALFFSACAVNGSEHPFFSAANHRLFYIILEFFIFVKK